jgi:integrase/recombinase XerD
MSKEYLDPGDVTRLENCAGGPRDQLLIRLLSRLGCRISEALGIRVEDVDLDQATVRIEHLKTRLQSSCPRCNAVLGRKHIFCPACGEKVEAIVSQARSHRRMRVLPLDRETVDRIARYIDGGAYVNRAGNDMLFGISRHRAWQIVRECELKAGLPAMVNPETGRTRGVSPHRLRDAFAVMAMKTDDSGEGMRLLQEHLGHASFNTTARYRKVAGEEHRAWYDLLWRK